MTENQPAVETINFDEFLPMPGADDILTPATKTNVLSKSAPEFNTDFLDTPEDQDDPTKTTSTPDDTRTKGAEILEDITKTDDDQEDESGTTKTTRRVDKSGMVETFSKMIEEGVLVGFDDDKKLEDYSLKDFRELLEANFQERERAIREEVPVEFFKSLPKELQFAAKYAMDGGTDMKGLFRALSHSEEVRALDPAKETDQEAITRNYLRATQFGTEEEITEEINSWKDLGVLNKKALQFKPKLDKMQEQVVQARLEQQENAKQQQLKAAQDYRDNVFNTLKTGELNGLQLDKKTQSLLFSELTQANYESMSGKKTNLLGHLLEKYQFSNEPRHDLIAEALWLLQDPEGYKEKIRVTGKNQSTQDTVRKLKTEEARKITTTTPGAEEEETSGKPKRIARPSANFFKR